MPAASSPARTAAASWAAPAYRHARRSCRRRSDSVEPSRAATSPSRTIRTARSATLRRVRQHRAGQLPRRQRSVRLVRAIGKSFRRHAKGRAREPAESSSDPGRPDEHERGIERRDGLRDRLGDVGPPHAHVVERAVRLHVAKRRALRLRDRAQRADLIEHEIGDSLGSMLISRRPKPARSGNPGCAPIDTPASRRQADGVAHHCGIARMKSAGDAAGCDGAQESLVVAGFVNAEGLADVGVQVYFQSRGHRRPAVAAPLAATSVALGVVWRNLSGDAKRKLFAPAAWTVDVDAELVEHPDDAVA